MVVVAIKSPLTIFASDAYCRRARGIRGHGKFGKGAGRYVRETRALSLMDAIRKMTLMPAQRLEARVRQCARRDACVSAQTRILRSLTATVVDRSTYREPSLSPSAFST